MLSWVPDTLLNQNQNNKRKIQVKLLCGADLLESFAVPNLWASEDVSILFQKVKRIRKIFVLYLQLYIFFRWNV